jgi:hypothetical protein
MCVCVWLCVCMVGFVFHVWYILPVHIWLFFFFFSPALVLLSHTSSAGTPQDRGEDLPRLFLSGYLQYVIRGSVEMKGLEAGDRHGGSSWKYCELEGVCLHVFSKPGGQLERFRVLHGWLCCCVSSNLILSLSLYSLSLYSAYLS